MFLLQPLGFGVLSRFVTRENHRVHAGRRDQEIILQGFRDGFRFGLAASGNEVDAVAAFLHAWR